MAKEKVTRLKILKIKNESGESITDLIKLKDYKRI